MKFKSLFITGLCSFAVLMSACSDDPEYTPAQPVDVPQAYFSLKETNNYVLGESDNQVSVNLYRAKAGSELTVPVTLNVVPAEAAALFTCPATATFAADADVTTIDIDINTADLDGAITYTLNVVVGEGKATPYFSETAAVVINYRPWLDVVGPNGEEYGEFTDGILAPLYGLDDVTYPVKIQQSPVVAGLYRIVDPYGDDYPYSVYNSLEYPGSYMYFNCSKPNNVFLCDENGNALNADGSCYYYFTDVMFNDEDGEMLFTGFYNYNLSKGTNDTSYFGTLNKGVLTFPAKSLLIGFTNDNNLYYGNSKGTFKIVFPGVEEEPEPEAVWTDLGQADFTDGIIYPFFFDTTDGLITWQVDVQQLEDDPSMYRLVNPWKDGVCPFGADYEGDIYVEIDATNPNCVFLPMQETGVFAEEFDSSVEIINIAYNMKKQGNADELIIATGNNDTLKDGVFTFGTSKGKDGNISHLRVYFPELPEGHEYAGYIISPGDFTTTIKLPEAAGTSAKASVVANGANILKSHQVKVFDAIEMPFKIATKKLR